MTRGFWQTEGEANYYFGGFDNNYVDDGEVKRCREYDSMPVFEINAISARKATGFRKGAKLDDEILLSLKIL